jgi:hypothetical protein
MNLTHRDMEFEIKDLKEIIRKLKEDEVSNKWTISLLSRTLNVIIENIESKQDE